MKRLLVTGGSGYLGAEVVRLAASDPDADIVATFHTCEPEPQSGVDWVELDLTDTTSILRVLREERPDVVVNTAYAATGDARIATADGVFELATTAARLGARLIHVSTDVVFDGAIDDGSAYTEADEGEPVHDYGIAKHDAESAAAAGHPFAVIARTSLIYTGDAAPTVAPGRHEQVVFEAVDGAAASGPDGPVFFDDEWRNPIQVSDLASALLELAGFGPAGPTVRSTTGLLHVAGADTVSRWEFARLIAAANGRDPDLVRSGSGRSSETPRPRNCALDSTRARSMLATRLRGVRAVLGPPSS